MGLITVAFSSLFFSISHPPLPSFSKFVGFNYRRVSFFSSLPLDFFLLSSSIKYAKIFALAQISVSFFHQICFFPRRDGGSFYGKWLNRTSARAISLGLFALALALHLPDSFLLLRRRNIDRSSASEPHLCRRCKYPYCCLEKFTAVRALERILGKTRRFNVPGNRLSRDY